MSKPQMSDLKYQHPIYGFSHSKYQEDLFAWVQANAKSSCCNDYVTYSKGSYMGSFDTTCSRCGKYCSVRENSL